MSANLNKVLLMGNLTRDPELRVTPRGTAICQFGMAISRQFKDESGNAKEETTFVDVEAWGRQGETISKFCTKGRPLFVEGRLRFDQWEDKASGQKRSKLKVVVENFQFIGDRSQAQDTSSTGSQGYMTPPSQQPSGQGSLLPQQPRQGSLLPRQQSTPPPVDISDDDVPF